MFRLHLITILLAFLLLVLPSSPSAENLNTYCKCGDINVSKLWDADNGKLLMRVICESYPIKCPTVWLVDAIERRQTE